jgi:hypothetical protein
MNRRLKEKLENHLAEFYVQSGQIPATLNQQAHHLIIEKKSNTDNNTVSIESEQK